MRPESHHKRRSAARAFGRKKRRPSHREKAARRRVRKRSQAGAPDRAAAQNGEKGTIAFNKTQRLRMA